jgi:hypothetical protein
MVRILLIKAFMLLFRWNALDQEMRLDVQRIWKRNMGRDDRCISDHGKEVSCLSLDFEFECLAFSVIMGLVFWLSNVYYCTSCRPVSHFLMRT